jgi:predicted nucleotidyltransferase component of viral defense system
MITTHRITRRADDDGVDAGVVERDYVLAHVVAQLPKAHMPGGGRLVFKGGTALRFVHVEDYRYSADLDFTVLDGSVETAAAALSEAVAAAKEHAGFPNLEIQISKGTPPQLAYVGPLGAKPRTVKVDLAAGEHVESVVQGEVLASLWDDLPAGLPFDVYPLDEIAAEKLRCVIQRVQCRDLYDLLRLTRDLKVDLRDIRGLFERKSRIKALDPASFREKFEDRTERYKERWEREMGEHLADPPRFEDVLRIVRRNLRAASLI